MNKKNLLAFSIGISIGRVITSFISSSVQFTNFWQSIAILSLAINSIKYEKELK